MAYRFNNGRGAVTCDNCNVIYDADLSYKEYEESYNGILSGDDGDFCIDCKNPNLKKGLEKWRKIIKDLK